MGLLVSWRESLYLFLPKNLKTLLASTWRVWVEAWKASWFYLLGIVCAVSVNAEHGCGGVYFEFANFVFTKEDVGFLLVLAFIAFFLFAARSSKEQKNASYLFRMASSYGLQVVALLIALKYLLRGGSTGWVSEIVVALEVWVLLFFFMFLFDSPPWWHPMSYLKSAWNSLAFIVYQIPLVVLGNALVAALILGILFGVYGIYPDAWSSLADQLRYLATCCPVLVYFIVFFSGAMVLTAYLSFWVSAYTKRVRDNPDLYL